MISASRASRRRAAAPFSAAGTPVVSGRHAPGRAQMGAVPEVLAIEGDVLGAAASTPAMSSLRKDRHARRAMLIKMN